MDTAPVYNQSACRMETGAKCNCPRCEGVGGLALDRGQPCSLCGGKGKLWKTDSGWIRPLYGRASDSVLY